MIKFHISHLFALCLNSKQFYWPIDRTLSGTTTPGQRRSGSNSNEGVYRIPQSFSITGTSPSDCLVPYLGHSLEGTYSSGEMQSAYSITPVDWFIRREIHREH